MERPEGKGHASCFLGQDKGPEYLVKTENLGEQLKTRE